MEILRKPHSKGQAIKRPTSLSGWYFGLSLFCGIFFTSTTGDIQITNSNEDILATPSGSSKRDDPGGGNVSSFLISSSEAPAIIQTSNNIEDTTQDSISFSYPMKNHVRFEGETLRLICEAKGNPPPLEIQWFKDHLPLEKQNRRIKIRRKETGEKDSMRSVVRIRNLEIMDKGIYRCDVRSSLKTISSESLVQVHPKKLKNWGRQHNNKHQMVSKQRCLSIRIYESRHDYSHLFFIHYASFIISSGGMVTVLEALGLMRMMTTMRMKMMMTILDSFLTHLHSTLIQPVFILVSTTNFHI